ncbi:hypothetical protein ASG77_12840 [Arthrobacter sp. Soil762]|nr:hypothetical protein ASG77_12840 [Arthrobacter sp. Soil762]
MVPSGGFCCAADEVGGDLEGCLGEGAGEGLLLDFKRQGRRRRAGYFTVTESIVISGEPILWIATLVCLTILANKGSAAARSNQIEHLPVT